MEITAKQRIERLEETSEAILKELKKISYDIKDRSKEGSDEEISNDQAEKPLFRWYEHTLPGPELGLFKSERLHTLPCVLYWIRCISFS